MRPAECRHNQGECFDMLISVDISIYVLVIQGQRGLSGVPELALNR